jgi:acetylornithine deacetylase
MQKTTRNTGPLDPVQLSRTLVDIDSTTYAEGAVGHFLAEFLDGRGFAIEKTAVAQPPHSKFSGERFNVYAGIAGEQPEVVLSTHMDTVPPWFGSREDDAFIYGRGSCDAKGIIAAQIAAAEKLRDNGVKAGLLFLVGEERDSAGAKIANQFPKASRYLINGEPTDNRLAIASKGALRASIRAKGKMAHSAYPELGESAVNKLIAALSRVLDLELPVVDDIGASTLNIGMIEGGRAPNVVPDHAEAQLLVRTVGDSQATRTALTEAVAGLADIDFPLEIPFMRMRHIDGMQTMVASFTSDVPALTNWGEPLLIGPGSIHVAHTLDEKLSKRELFEAIDLYTQIAGSLVG